VSSSSPIRLPGIGAHHSANPQTDEWITPRWILDGLPRFDLDPCASLTQPWPTAAAMLTVADDGLAADWAGTVWCNPPYSAADVWMARLAAHGDGMALVFARTETRWWFESVWPAASALLFIAGRVTFHRPDGTTSKAGHNAGGPSVLIAYGATCAGWLRDCTIRGALATVDQVIPGSRGGSAARR
jgi:phage N-6-adenine-methyltransferase